MSGVFKALLLSPVIGLMVSLGVGVALLFGPPRAVRWARRWMAGAFVLYLTLCLQGTSDVLVGGLSRGHARIVRAVDAPTVRTIVVLGNGARVRSGNGQELTAPNLQSAHNALEAARLYRLLGDPIVVASGASFDRSSPTPESRVLSDALESLGVPKDRIVVEGQSRSTRQQAVNVSLWLKERNETTFVLVTSPEHMWRAERAFIVEGVRPIPSPSLLRYGGSPPWQPRLMALDGSVNALYEYVALGVYWWRGWI